MSQELVVAPVDETTGIVLIENTDESAAAVVSLSQESEVSAVAPVAEPVASKYRMAARQALDLPVAAMRLKRHLEAILPLRNASRSGEQNAVVQYIKGVLDAMGRPYTTDTAFNIYVAPLALPEGWSLRGIVGHTDSVMQHGGEDIEPITYENGIYRSLNGKRPIGGDDKVGVAIALTLAEFLPWLSAIFPADEEVGCVGASQMDLPKHYLMVECDRRGGEDIVTEIGATDMLSMEARKVALSLLPHRKATYGLFTDVLAFRTRGLTDHATNLSCGYYAPHSCEERIVFAQTFQTLIDAATLLTDMPDDLEAAVDGSRYRPYSGGGRRGWQYDDNDYAEEWGNWANEGGYHGGHHPFGPNRGRQRPKRHSAQAHHSDTPPPGIVLPPNVEWANLSKRKRRQFIRDAQRAEARRPVRSAATNGAGEVGNRLRTLFSGISIPAEERAPEIYRRTGLQMRLIGWGSLFKLNVDRMIRNGLYYETDQWEHAEDVAGFWHLLNLDSGWLFVYDSTNNRWCLRTDRRDSTGGTVTRAEYAIQTNAGI